MIYLLSFSGNKNTYNVLAAFLESRKVAFSFLFSKEEFVDNFKNFTKDDYFLINVWEKNLNFVYEFLNTYSKYLKIIVGGVGTFEREEEFLRRGAWAVCSGDGESYLENLVANSLPQGIFRGYFLKFNETNSIPENLFYYSPIEVVRGCVYGCNFCQTPYYFGRKYRIKDFEIFEEDVFRLLRKYKNIKVIASNSAVFIKKYLNELKEFISKVKREKKEATFNFGSFPSEIHPLWLDEEILQFLKEYSSNKNISIGAQSAVDRILKLQNRNHTWNEVENAVRLAIRYDYLVKVDILFGTPTETCQDQIYTLNKCLEMYKKYRRVKFRMHYLIPLRGTKFYNEETAIICDEAKELIEKFFKWGIAEGSI